MKTIMRKGGIWKSEAFIDSCANVNRSGNTTYAICHFSTSNAYIHMV